MINEDEVYEILDRLMESDDAMDELQCIYYPLIKSLAYGLFSATKYYGVDLQDLIQEGRIALYDAATSYKDNMNTKFTTFFYLCCTRRMNSYVNSHRRLKHRILTDSLSLNDKINEGSSLLEIIANNNAYDPVQVVIKSEWSEKLEEEVEGFSKLEKEIYDLKKQGYSYREIASILDKPIKTIDNGLHRLKKKIQRFKY